MEELEPLLYMRWEASVGTVSLGDAELAGADRDRGGGLAVDQMRSDGSDQLRIYCEGGAYGI